MKRFTPYLQRIGIKTKSLLERIEFIYNISSEMCPEEIEDIFVTDYIKEDGTREYENLWFFSTTYCLEAKQFMTKFDLDITPLKKRVNYWTITMQDYNFKKAIHKSRLSLTFRTPQEITGVFKAAKENCDSLKDIITKYVKPNLMK